MDFTVGSAVGDAVAVASGEGVGVSAACSEAAALRTLCVFSAVPQAAAESASAAESTEAKIVFLSCMCFFTPFSRFFKYKTLLAQNCERRLNFVHCAKIFHFREHFGNTLYKSGSVM